MYVAQREITADLFKAGCGVTQGGPLSAKLFNIIIDAVVREWIKLMRETLDDSEVTLPTKSRPSLPSFMWTMVTLH